MTLDPLGPDWLAATPAERRRLLEAMAKRGELFTPAAQASAIVKPPPRPPKKAAAAEIREAMKIGDVVFGPVGEIISPPRPGPTLAPMPRPLAADLGPAVPRRPPPRVTGLPIVASPPPLPPSPRFIPPEPAAMPPPQAMPLPRPSVAAEDLLSAVPAIAGQPPLPSQPPYDPGGPIFTEGLDKGLSLAAELTGIPQDLRILEKMREGYSAEDAIRAVGPPVHVGLGGPRGSLGAGPSWFRRPPPEAREGVGRYISIGEHESGLERLVAEAAKARQTLIDELHPIREAERAMRAGTAAEGAEAVYHEARVSRGAAGKSNAVMLWGPIDAATLQPTGAPSLTDVRAAIRAARPRGQVNEAVAQAEFRRYATASRARELHARGIETGMDPAVVEADFNRFDRYYRPAFDQLQAYQNDNLKYARDRGMISEDSYRAILEDNTAYVPFQRVLDNEAQFGGGGKRFVNIQSGIRKIAGSELKILDPLESVIKHTHDVIAAADKNAVGQGLVKLARANPSVARLMPARRTDPDAFFVTVGGQRKYFTAAPALREALEALSPSDLHPIFEGMRHPASWLRAGATLTPEFQTGNILRDSFAAFIQSRYGFVPLWDTAKGAFAMVGRADMYKNWMRAGGDNAFLTTIDRTDVQDQLARVFGDAAEARAMNIVNPINALRTLSEISEKTTRVGAFGRAISGNPALEAVGLAQPGLGTSREGLIQAAISARESTVDFQTMGQYVKALNAISPFTNARIQGWDRMAATLSDPKTASAAWVKATAGITLPSMTLTALNMQDPRWESIPQWEKIAFWHVMVKDGPVLRIPKPPGYAAVFANPFEAITEFVGKHDPKAVGRIAQGFTQEAPALLPTAIGPAVEAAANKSFFRDAPIIPPSVKRLDPGYQAGPATTETAKTIGEAAGVSPAILEHLARGYFGGLGAHTLGAADLLLPRGREAAAKKPASGLEKIPGVKAFYSSYERGSDQLVTDFYDKLESASERHATLEKFKREQPEKAYGYYVQHRQEIDSHPLLSEVGERLSALRARENAITASPRLSADDKRKQIAVLRQQRSALVRRAIRPPQRREEAR